MVAGTEIKRRVGDRIIKRIREIYTAVANQPDVASKLDGVPSMDPGNIIRDVVDGCHTGECVGFAIGLEHETESDVIPVAVTALGECLAPYRKLFTHLFPMVQV